MDTKPYQLPPAFLCSLFLVNVAQRPQMFSSSLASLSLRHPLIWLAPLRIWSAWAAINRQGSLSGNYSDF